MNERSVVNRFFNSSSLYILASIFNKGVGFITLPLFTALMSPREYGSAVFVTSLIAFALPFVLFNFHGGINRFYVEYKEGGKEFKESMGSYVLASLILAVFSLMILMVVGPAIFNPFLGEISYFPYMFFAVFTMVTTPLWSILFSFLTVREAAATYTGLILFQRLLPIPIILVGIVYFQMGGLSIILGNMVCSVVLFFVALFFFNKEVTWCLKWVYLKPFFKYNVSVFSHSLIGKFNAIVDKIMIKAFINIESVGFYNVGLVFCEIIDVIITNINTALNPIYYKIRENNSDKEIREYQTISNVIMILICLSGIFISFFTPYLILLLFKVEYLKGADIIPFITFSSIAHCFYSLFAKVMFYEKKLAKYITVCSGSGFIINIIGNLLLIPRLGIKGASISVLISGITIALIAIRFARKHDIIKWHFGKIGLIYLVSLSVVLLNSHYIEIDQMVPLQIAAKLVVILGLFFIYSIFFFGDKNYIIHRVTRLEFIKKFKQ